MEKIFENFKEKFMDFGRVLCGDFGFYGVRGEGGFNKLYVKSPAKCVKLCRRGRASYKNRRIQWRRI